MVAIPVPTDIATMFDSYGRQARLFPGLLTIFPPLLAVLAWFPWLIVSSVTATLLTLAMSCGLLYALASWARTKGRRIEPGLRREWGGWPTTILLRHTSELDIHTRHRYHAFLAAALPTLAFPTAEQEAANPADATAVYDSAIVWLKELASGKEFSMVDRENAQYGFRRNLRGLKPVGIILCLLTLLASMAAVLYTNPSSISSVEDKTVSQGNQRRLSLALAYTSIATRAFRLDEAERLAVVAPENVVDEPISRIVGHPGYREFPVLRLIERPSSLVEEQIDERITRGGFVVVVRICGRLVRLFDGCDLRLQGSDLRLERRPFALVGELFLRRPLHEPSHHPRIASRPEGKPAMGARSSAPSDCPVSIVIFETSGCGSITAARCLS